MFNNSSTSSFVNKSTHSGDNTVSKIDHDFDSLTKFLKENGVLDEDINFLENLIEIEGSINLESGYGKKVKELITELISKSTQ